MTRFIFFSIVPIALRRPDPYSINAVQQAQETAASLLAENPGLAESWAQFDMSGLRQEIRGNILTQAFSLERTLSVPSHFGSLSRVLGNDAERVTKVLRQIEDKYSVSDQYRGKVSGPKRSWSVASPMLSVAIGVFITVMAVVAAALLPNKVPGETPGLLNVLLPLLGVIVAVHLLAIELASGRLPRLATIAVASFPRIVLAYGFFISSIAYSYVGASIRPLEAEAARTWEAITLAFSFGLLALVVYDLLQTQDDRVVVRALAKRNRKTAQRAADEYANALKSNANWQSAIRTFRNIRQTLGPPVARHHAAITADRGGLLRFDGERLQRVDLTLDDIHLATAGTLVRKSEVLLVRQPGVVVSRGELVAAIVADEPEHIRQIGKDLKAAIYIDTSIATGHMGDVVAAISRVFAQTVREQEREASKEIAGYLQEVIEVGLSKGGELGGGSGSVAFPPAISAVHALERVYREALFSGDEFTRDGASRALVNLARTSLDYPASYIVEAVSGRLEILADDMFESEAIKSVVSTWAEVSKIVSLARRGAVRRQIVKDMGDTSLRLAKVAGRGTDSSFCIDRYAEMLTATMYADYFASDDVIKGTEKIATIVRGAGEPMARYAAAMCLLEIGAAALEYRRYSIAYLMIQVMAAAGLDLDRDVQNLRRVDVASRLQFKSNLAGEVFGEDVEAAVIRYRDWITSLQVKPN